MRDSEKIVKLRDCKSRESQRIVGVRVLEGGSQKKNTLVVRAGCFKTRSLENVDI